MEVELATCRTSLLRARPRLDLVCILLDRRIMSSSRWVRYKNRSIHIQCDSSPIEVRELFGMPMDVFFLGMTWVERCLSGVAMGHGHTACKDKCTNLLWLLWLFTAPNKNLFADVPQHIGSFTTDQGVEANLERGGIGISLMVCKHIGVQLPGDMVAHGLILSFAVHTPDLNHMNTMRNACKAVECWPRFFPVVRRLTKCFRNEDY